MQIFVRDLKENLQIVNYEFGEEVKIYFKDTMYISGICEKEDKEKIKDYLDE